MSLAQRIISVPIDSIKPRPGNPNRMDDKVKGQLEYSIENFDYNRPILIDQNNILIDGEQRLNALKSLGYQSVDAVVKTINSEEERRLLSQAMNKIHGEHDLTDDITELKSLYANDSQALEAMLGVNQDALDIMVAQHEQQQEALRSIAEQEGGYTPVDVDNQGYGEIKDGNRMADSNPVSRHAETYLHGGIKQITLYFDNQSYQEVMSKITQWMEAGNFESTTELFKNMMEVYSERYPINVTATGDNTNTGEETA